MKPIKFKKVYQYYVPIKWSSKYQGKYANLILFLTEEIFPTTFESWINFLEDDQYEIRNADSVQLIQEKELVEIYNILDGDISQKKKEPFVIDKLHLKQIILNWIKTQKIEPNSITMKEKNGKVIFTGSKKKIIPSQKILCLEKRKQPKTNKMVLAKVLLNSKKNKFRYSVIETKYHFHVLNSLLSLLEDEIKNNDLNHWIQWLETSNSIYKKGNYAESKKIKENQIIIADTHKKYTAPIEQDPYALYISVKTLKSIIKDWRRIRARQPDRIILIYANNKISVEYEGAKHEGTVEQTMPILWFPYGFYQLEVIEAKKAKKYIKSTFFPQNWTNEQAIDTMREAEEYYKDHPMGCMFVNHASTNHCFEGYTKSGIRIRISVNMQDFLVEEVFPVVESTYENATRDLLPYPENE